MLGERRDDLPILGRSVATCLSWEGFSDLSILGGGVGVVTCLSQEGM